MNIRQQKFVAEYVKDGNGARAARAAGYTAKSARRYGSRLLRLPQIAAAVEAARAALAARLEVDAERVIGEYVRIGFADLRRIFDAQGNLLHPRDMDDDTVAAIAEIEVVRKPGGETVHKIKRIDKKGALDSLARALGLFRDKLEFSGAENLAARLDAARKRVGG
jgi:phage terminase small subunit